MPQVTGHEILPRTPLRLGQTVKRTVRIHTRDHTGEDRRVPVRLVEVGTTGQVVTRPVLHPATEQPFREFEVELRPAASEANGISVQVQFENEDHPPEEIVFPVLRPQVLRLETNVLYCGHRSVTIHGRHLEGCQVEVEHQSATPTEREVEIEKLICISDDKISVHLKVKKPGRVNFRLILPTGTDHLNTDYAGNNLQLVYEEDPQNIKDRAIGSKWDLLINPRTWITVAIVLTFLLTAIRA